MPAYTSRHAASHSDQAFRYGSPSGSSLKTRILLDHVPDLAGYVPVDISREHLLSAAAALASVQYLVVTAPKPEGLGVGGMPPHPTMLYVAAPQRLCDKSGFIRCILPVAHPTCLHVGSSRPTPQRRTRYFKCNNHFVNCSYYTALGRRIQAYEMSNVRSTTKAAKASEALLSQG